MEIGEDFAVEAKGEESDSDSDDEDEDGGASDGGAVEGEEEGELERKRRDKGKGREQPRGARRSDRTKRRDFSIVWSGLKRCFQLFLGPARFLNVSCVALESTGERQVWPCG